jgi:hypothetical protein
MVEADAVVRLAPFEVQKPGVPALRPIRARASTALSQPVIPVSCHRSVLCS